MCIIDFCGAISIIPHDILDIIAIVFILLLYLTPSLFLEALLFQLPGKINCILIFPSFLLSHSHPYSDSVLHSWRLHLLQATCSHLKAWS